MVVLVLGGGCFDDEDALTTNDNDDARSYGSTTCSGCGKTSLAISHNIDNMLNIFGLEIVHQPPRPLLSGLSRWCGVR